MILRFAIALAGIGFWIQTAEILSAQSPVEAGKRAIERRQFPWFDAESESLTEIERKDTGRAGSLDRGDVPLRTPKAGNTGSDAAPQPTGGWTPLVEALIWILIGILFLLIVAAIGWIYLKMEVDSRNSGSMVKNEDVEAVRSRIRQLPFGMQQDFKGDFREMALHHSGKGEYGHAMMMLFSHVLLELDRKGLIRLRTGKTNRQYLGELESHDRISAYYRQVMVPFEESFFGDHAIHQPVFERCWNELDQFHQQLAHTEPAVRP